MDFKSSPKADSITLKSATHFIIRQKCRPNEAQKTHTEEGTLYLRE